MRCCAHMFAHTARALCRVKIFTVVESAVVSLSLHRTPSAHTRTEGTRTGPGRTEVNATQAMRELTAGGVTWAGRRARNLQSARGGRCRPYPTSTGNTTSDIFIRYGTACGICAAQAVVNTISQSLGLCLLLRGLHLLLLQKHGGSEHRIGVEGEVARRKGKEARE